MHKLLITCLIAAMFFTSAVAVAASPTLKDVIDDMQKFQGYAGVYAINLKTGESFSYNADSVFPTASTSKLMVALAVYKYLYSGAAQGKKDLYDKDIAAMITVSDNCAYFDLIYELENYCPDGLNKVAADLALSDTLIHDNKAYQKYNYHSVTTPCEMAKVMQAIYDENYLGNELSGKLKTELANTIFASEIPRYIKSKVLHKVGELDNVLCDVGIVDDGAEAVLISFYTTTDGCDPYASDFIATTSAKLYAALRTPDEQHESNDH